MTRPLWAAAVIAMACTTPHPAPDASSAEHAPTVPSGGAHLTTKVPAPQTTEQPARPTTAAAGTSTGAPSSTTEDAAPPSQGMVRFQPGNAGKPTGPVGIAVQYPVSHPLGKPLTVTVEVWSTDADAESLTVAARPDPGIAWDAGQPRDTFAGPVPRFEHRTYRFSVVPNRPGESIIAIDAGRVRNGRPASRTIAIPIHGGGSIDPSQLPGAQQLP